MKKLISAILCMAVLAPSAVFAESNSDEMQKILASVKERVGDTEQYSEFNSSVDNDEYGTIYGFSWDDHTDGEWKNMNVACNGDGVITLYNVTGPDIGRESGRFSINRTPRAEALKKAQEAVDKLNPSLKGDLVVSDYALYENFRSDNYVFSIQRYENGIPVWPDVGNIRLDGKCNVVHFGISYTTGLEFASTENAISEKDATDAYNSKIGVKLYYTKKYDKDKESIELVYGSSSDKYIDAITGEAISPEQHYYISEQESLAMDAGASGGGSNQKSFSEAEKKNIEEIDGLISEERACEIVSNCRFFDIAANTKPSYVSLTYRYYDKRYIYALSYGTDSETGFSAYVYLDAKTGEIVTFNKWKKSDKSENELSKEQATKLADEIVAELAKDKASEYKIDETDAEKLSYVTYKRYVNGINFDENVINVGFDGDGRLRSYYIDYDILEFPSPDGIITKEEAFDKIKAGDKYRIYYVADYASKKFVPVYRLSAEGVVDAFTGKSAWGYEAEVKKGGEYTDIDGHYAQKQIETLAKYGIFFDGTEFRPDEAITQKDYMALLAIVFYHNDAEILRNYYTADKICAAFPGNFFDKDITPDAPLTRSDAAKFMVRAMGGEEYAKLPGIYASLYKDVTENIGYINILTAFGVVSGDGEGNFNPNRETTRAQAVIMLYNYLSR